VKDRAKTVKARVERDFIEALERLKAGTPTCKQLVRLKEQHKLKITVRNVALEAGRAHTPLYRQHRHILEQIRSCSPDGDAKKLFSPSDKIRELSMRLRESMAQRDQLATHNQHLTLRVRHLETMIQSLQQKRGNVDSTIPFDPGPHRSNSQ
jgi:hypothetical protein